MSDNRSFEPDTATTNPDKNGKLADLLDGPYVDRSILLIERTEDGVQRGWRVTYGD